MDEIDLNGQVAKSNQWTYFRNVLSAQVYGGFVVMEHLQNLALKFFCTLPHML